jgi:hypothetical protein
LLISGTVDASLGDAPGPASGSPLDFVPTSTDAIIAPKVHWNFFRRLVHLKPACNVIVLDMRRGNARPFMASLLNASILHGIYDISRDPTNRFCYSASLAEKNGKWHLL